MKYCKATTEGHKIAKTHKCIKQITIVLLREGWKSKAGLFSENQTVIDLDLLEECLSKKQKRDKLPSMDIAFGVELHNREKNLLLVELKLNVSNPNNLDLTDLKDKIHGSKLALSHEFPINNRFVFVFQTKIIEQIRNRLSRQIPRIPSSYEVLDVHSLKGNYF